MAPTASGQSALVDDMGTTAGWTATPLGGGTVSIATTSGRHSGVGAMAVNYNFAGASTGAELRTSKVLSGQPTAISVWVYGDRTNSQLQLKFVDATGESFQAQVGHSAAQSWKRETFYLDGGNPNFTHSGGNNDGKVDYPITVTSIFVYKSTSANASSGQVIVDDLTAGYGTIVRGSALLGNGTNTQAAYSLTAVSAALPVADTVAYLRVGSTTSPLVVSSRVATVALGPDPSFVTSALGFSATSTPVSAPVSALWMSGDRSTVTVAVLSSDGVVVRTLKSAAVVNAGLQNAVWDGKAADGSVAAPGTYRFRITATGIDGRVSNTSKNFTRT